MAVAISSGVVPLGTSRMLPSGSCTRIGSCVWAELIVFPILELQHICFEAVLPMRGGNTHYFASPLQLQSGSLPSYQEQ